MKTPTIIKRNTIRILLTGIIFFYTLPGTFAQLSGIYTIDPAGGDFTSNNFKSFTEAVDSLVSQGVSAAVTINIADGTYTEKVVIPQITGASAVNRITFQSQSLDSTTVTLTYLNTTSTNNWTLRLNDADYITLRKIHIQATGSSYGRVININGNAHDNLIEHCFLQGFNSGSTSNNLALIYSYIDQAESNIFRNNYFLNGSYGIYMTGLNSTTLSNGNTISGNQFTNQAGYGIYMQYQNAPIISDNDFFTNQWSGPHAIHLWQCDNNMIVTGNSINYALGGYGIYLDNSDGTLGGEGLITNNFVAIGGTGTANGIYINNSTFEKIYHNSVNITSTTTGSSSNALYVTGGSNLDVRNNIFANMQSGYAINIRTASALTLSDFNNYYTTGNYLAYWTQNIPELSDLQGVNGKDANSVSVNPLFVSDADLHTTTNLLDGAGDGGLGVTVDIDGETRLSPPDIGADEFTGTGIPLSGTYTIGGSTPDYATFTDAVNALNSMGVNGPVIFNVRNGTYNEQIRILPITGAGITNTVTFQSESGDSSQVIMTYNSDATNNYIVQLKGADFVTFSKLTFSALNVTNARVFSMQGSTHDVTLSHCVFNSDVSGATNQSTVHSYNSYLNNIVVEYCKVNGGKYGIFLNSNNQNNPTGIRILYNQVSQTQGSLNYGIYLRYSDAPEVTGNTIGNIISTSFYGINLSDCINGFIISRNKITLDNSSGAIRIYGSNGTVANRGLVSNNIVQCYGTGTAYGIYTYGSSYLDILYNTVLIASGDKNNGIAYYNSGGSSKLVLKNNIFVNTGGGYAFYTSSGTDITTSDFNDLFVTGNFIGYWGGTKTTGLADFQNTSGQEANGLSVNPVFDFTPDLRPRSSFLDGTGTPVSVTTDFDGNLRDVTTPDPGAFEFTSSFVPLSGPTYTIGGASPDYTSFTDAADDLNNRGVSGPVTFLIRPGTYNEQFDLMSISGASPTNRVTFASENGDSTSVEISFNAGSSNNYVIRLLGADFITFRNLTVTALNNTYSTAIELSGNAYTDSILNNVVHADLSGVSYTGAINSFESNISDIVIRNNVITGGRYGIQLNSNSSGMVAVNTVIADNDISGQNTSSPRGIYLNYHDAPVVSGNKLVNNSAASYYGIWLFHCSNDFVVEKNRVSSNNTSGCIIIDNCNGSLGRTGLVANNFCINGGAGTARGIYLYNTTYTNVYFNSVRITSTDAVYGRAFYSINGSNIRVMNNIFYNTGGGYAYYTNSGTSIIASDYNDLYSTGNYLAYWTNNITDLPSLQSASGLETNSISAVPGFVSASDLHATSSFLDNQGTPIAAVPDDIDGETRSATTPDIGADEFTATLFPLTGTYTIGGTNPDYATFTDAVIDLKTLGISGTVVFNIRPGTYNEQITIPDVSGASATDSVIFQSESGDSSSVVLTYSATGTADNFVVHLAGADFLTFRNMTISATSPIYGTVFLIDGFVQNINILHNVLSCSAQANNSNLIFAPDPVITENLVIGENLFSEGVSAIYIDGNNTNPGTGILISGNRILSAGSYGIYVRDLDAPRIIANVIENNTSGSTGIYINNCDNGLRVIGNRSFNTDYGTGIHITYCNATLADPGLIANNFSGINGTSSTKAMIVENCDYQNIYYNSTLVTSSNTGSMAFYLQGGTNIRLLNNIFANTGAGYAYYINTTAAVVTSDFNNIYSTGANLARWNGNITSLTGLQSASGLDQNSLSADPMYLSPTDLHTIQSAFHQAATPVTEVGYDIDSIPRDPVNPDIGAQEFYCETPVFDIYISPACLGDSTTFIDNSTNIAPGSTFSWDFDNDFNPEITSADPHDTVYYTFGSAGDHTVNFIVSQIAGCNDYTPLTATVHASPVLAITTQGAYCDSANGSATATVLSGTGPFTYFWSEGSTDTIASGLTTGTYTVAVSDSFNCSTTREVVIGDAMQVTVTEVQGSTCGASDGIATVSVSGGVEPYIYVWSDGDTSATNNSLPPGIHYVNVIDANGCYSQGSVNIGNNGSGPQISLVGITHNNCYADQNGSVDITITGGVQPYVILWSNGEHTEDIDSLSAGIYDIQVIDNTGCITSERFIVTQPPALSVSDVIEDATCASNDGKAVVFASGGTQPYFYAWSTGGTDPIEENLQAGIYSVTITDARGCQTVHPVIINNIGGPVVTVNSVTGLTCTQTSGGAIDISVSGGTPLYSYMWSGGQTTQDINNLTLGDYSVTVTDAAGCVGVASASVIKTPPPSNPICLVTVDSVSGMNKVVWEKTVITDVDYYNIYRESSQKGNYQLVGQRPVDSLSEFIDSVANPAVRSWKYELSVVDKCGNESEFSIPHKTIHLTQNLGLNNTINLIWDHYEGFSFSSYNVYRFSSVSGWELLQTLASNLTSFTDLAPPSSGTFYYVVEVLLPQSCTSSAVKTSYNSARSNKTTTLAANTGTGTLMNGIDYLNLYPNPNQGIFMLSFSTRNNGKVIIRILDINGRQVWIKRLDHAGGKKDVRVDLSEMGSGVYHLQFITGKTIINKPVIIR